MPEPRGQKVITQSHNKAHKVNSVCRCHGMLCRYELGGKPIPACHGTGHIRHPGIPILRSILLVSWWQDSLTQGGFHSNPRQRNAHPGGQIPMGCRHAGQRNGSSHNKAAWKWRFKRSKCNRRRHLGPKLARLKSDFKRKSKRGCQILPYAPSRHSLIFFDNSATE